MKSKKIILLIFTILAMIIDISYTIAIFSGAINLENSGDAMIPISNTSQATLLGICGIINFISIFFICQDPMKHKKKLIFLNIFQLLIGNIFNIVSGIINVIILTRKAKDAEEIKVKKQLPVLEDITKHRWYVYFIIFGFLFILCYTPISNHLPIPDNKIAKIIAIVALYIIQIILLAIPMWNELKRDFVVFKNNFKLYLGNMLPRFGIIIIFYLISSFSVTFLVAAISTNQAILSTWPIYITAIVAIVVAPFTEELMFRGFIRKFIKNDILFVIISTLIFGGLHIISANSFEQFLFIIPYSILGFAFSLNYVKTKNIASNIFLHSAWNSIAVIGMILLKTLVIN